MQSSTMFARINNKIQFHGVKTVYPFGERLTCFINVPDYWQPENGDFIGIYPVGWSSIVRDCLYKKFVSVEELNGQQYGKIEFESIPVLPQYGEQLYQFVYVNQAGEITVLGQSMPFKFIGGEPMFGGKYNTKKWFPTGPYTQGNMFGGEQLFEESEWEKFQNEIAGLEQSGLWQLEGEFVGQQQQERTPFGWNKWTNGNGQVWQSRIVKIEQILKEKIRIEQAQRRLDQFVLMAQLKSFDRHIQHVLKREPEIKEFLLRAKLAVKIAAFEQKVYQVLKQKGSVVGAACDYSSPAEHYVRKYEQLLKEKIVLDIEKRRVVLHKLRQTIRECERRLGELQTLDQEHSVNFHTMLKSKLGQFETRFGGFAAPVSVYEEVTVEIRKHFETIMTPFLSEQERLGMNLYQAQRDLTYLVNEISGKLQEFEMTSGNSYPSLRIPKLITSLMFNCHPKLNQVVQLEKKIAEQKLKLKLRMLGLTNGSNYGMQFVEELSRGIWFAPIIEKLKQVQYYLAKTMPVYRGQTARGVWFEKKYNVLGQLIDTFTQFQTEVYPTGPVSTTYYPSWFGPSSTLFDQVKMRTVLGQLRELRERECMEIPRFFQQEIKQQHIVVELCATLGQLLAEKSAEISSYMQLPIFQQQQPSFEWMLNGQHGPAMLELFEIEKKLVEMKGLTIVNIHHMHLSERLSELEQCVRGDWFMGGEYQLKKERCIEKIRLLKALLGEHIEQQQQLGGSFFFTPVPEQFFQHQTKFEKLHQLIGELEYHFVEQFNFPTGFVQTIPSWSTMFGHQTTGLPYPGTTFGPRFGGIYSVHERFARLVQEFRLQFPECFVPKVEEIVAFLRDRQSRWINGGAQQPAFHAVFGQELREKLIEFEAILSQPECEISCLTTSIYPQSTLLTTAVNGKTQREVLKYLIRQIRDLKSQIQLGSFPVAGLECDEQLVEMMNNKMWIDINNNTVQMPYGSRVPFVGSRPTTTLVESTTTGPFNGSTTIVKSVSVPTMRPSPVTNGELISGTELTYPTIFGQKIRFGSKMPSTTYPSVYELVGDEWNGEENDYDFDGELDGEFDFEEVIATPNKWNTTQRGVQGGRWVVADESCICQIEKHIRKYLGGNKKVIVEKNEICPLCSVSVGKEITTTSVETSNAVRRF